MIKDLFLNKGNVYYATLHSNHKGVQCGNRPVILIGVYGSVVSVIPLTSKLKRLDLKQHVQIKTIEKGISMILTVYLNSLPLFQRKI